MSATKSLVDVARSMHAASPVVPNDAPAPRSLVDVARQSAAPATHANTTSVSLRQLAQAIDAEANDRVGRALATAANEVRNEQRAREQDVLHAAVVEVRDEEAHAAQQLVDKIKPSVNTSVATVAAAVSEGGGDDDAADADGYSSFGDDDDESDNNNEPGRRNTTNAKLRRALVEDDEGSDDAADSPVERTTASSSPESKAFLRAVYHADHRAIQKMLDGGDVDAATADQHGWSGLHWAAAKGHSAVLELLLQRGAPVNAVDHISGWSPLHVAAARETLACAKLLLERGANPQQRDAFGDTPVDLVAAMHRKPRTAFARTLQRYSSSA